jgi:hypothetical protein
MWKNVEKVKKKVEKSEKKWEKVKKVKKSGKKWEKVGKSGFWPKKVWRVARDPGPRFQKMGKKIFSGQFFPL